MVPGLPATASLPRVEDPYRPVWAKALGLFLTWGLGALIAAIALLDGDGPWALTMLAVGTVAILLGVAFLKAIVVRRRVRPLRPAPDGTVAFRSPVAIYGSLLAAALLIVLSSPLAVWAVLTDSDDMTRPGRLLALPFLGIYFIPDLVRLLLGRLHRWQLILGPEAVTYRGHRTDVTVPWSETRGVLMQTAKPFHLVIKTRGTKQPDIGIRFDVFDVPAQQFLDEIGPRIP